MSSETNHAENSESADHGCPLLDPETPAESERELSLDQSTIGQIQASGTTPTQGLLASPSSNMATGVFLGERKTTPVHCPPVQVAVCDQTPPSITTERTNEPAHSKEYDAQEENSTTVHETTRETIKADLAAGKLRIPDFGSRRPEFSPTQALTISDKPLTPYQSLRYRLSFGPALSPPNPDLAFKVQILENTRQWVLLAASIPEEKRRAEVLDRAFEKYEKVWFEALRIGYESGVRSTGGSGPRHESNAQAGDRKDRAAKSRKKDTPPYAVQIFVPEKFKNGHGRPFPVTAITAGELEEAGVTEEQVRKRACASDDARVDEVFRDLYDDLKRQVDQRDWYNVVAHTQLNPTGRDLFFYSLYVAQLYEANLDQLRRYQVQFKTNSQIKNGLRNIQNSMQGRSLFLALALELNDLETASDSGRSSADEDVDMHECSGIPTDTIEKLLEAIDPILEAQGFSDISQAFEASGYPESSLGKAGQETAGSNPVERGKKALTEILSYSRERDIAAQAIEDTDNEDDKRHWGEQVGTCETKIRETKKSLREIVPLLLQVYKDEGDDGKHCSSSTGQGLERMASAGIDTNAETPESAALKSGLKGGLKRLANSDDCEGESNPESPMKRQKLDIDIHGEHTGEAAVPEGGKQSVTEIEKTDTSTPAVVTEPSTQSQTMNPDSGEILNNKTGDLADHRSPSQQLPEKELSKKDRYIRDFLLPLANKLLRENGHRSLDSTVTDFQSAKDALRNTDLPVPERNKLVIGYNAGLFNDWNVANECETVHVQEPYTGPDIAPLVKHPSTKHTEQKDNEAETHSAPPSRPSLIVKLGMGPHSDFDPAQLSSNPIYNHKGFRYRYTRDSTLFERRAANEALDKFVRNRTACTDNRQYPRHGRYEAICLPDDPERKTIVHGFWDTKDAQLVEGAEWFYNEDRDHPTYVIDNLTKVEDEPSKEDGHFEGQIQSSRPSSSPSSTKRNRKVTFAPTATRAVVANHPKTNAQQRKSMINPKIKTAIRLRVHADNAKQSTSGNSISGQTSKAIATKQKAKVTDSNDVNDASHGTQKGRPKRARAKRSYALDDLEGETDEEYVPGQSD